MNKTVKIFILYCLPILTIQSCGKQCRPQPSSAPETNSQNLTSEPENNSQNLSQNPPPISSITEAMCEKTKDYLLNSVYAPAMPFFEQTIQEIRNGNPAAVNNQNPAQDKFTILHYTIYSDNEELFKELLKLSPDLTQKDAQFQKMTILLVAITQIKVNFVNMLLDQPNLATFIDEPTLSGETPLTYAQFMEGWTTIPKEKNYAQTIIQALQAKGAV